MISREGGREPRGVGGEAVSGGWGWGGRAVGRRRPRRVMMRARLTAAG